MSRQSRQIVLPVNGGKVISIKFLQCCVSEETLWSRILYADYATHFTQTAVNEMCIPIEKYIIVFKMTIKCTLQTISKTNL